MLRELNHPNIVKMLDMIQHEGTYYLIMEYIEGGDLADLLKARGKLSVNDAIKLALELAAALSRAYHLGIIHRDIKPANVLIAPNGTPRLTDFGVARMDTEDRLTGTGVAVGTLDYMPPEAINGEAVDARGDIWAFGVMLYEISERHPPVCDHFCSPYEERRQSSEAHHHNRHRQCADCRECRGSTCCHACAAASQHRSGRLENRAGRWVQSGSTAKLAESACQLRTPRTDSKAVRRSSLCDVFPGLQ